ncbi:MAG: ABC transporter ATP-binding protein [Pseudomonadota bacterium]|nr:ABC transporter ATP-binding protein [Pseudomonadota bacterium]
MSAETAPILACRGLRRDFRGFAAVEDFDLAVREGSIHALIGPNGAGKTTVFNLLTRFLPVSAGRILLRGEDITALPAERVVRRGLVRSFQISAVFAHLSALDNVRVALLARTGLVWQFWRARSTLDAFTDEAHHHLASVGLADLAHTPAVALPYGRKRALELATTLARDPAVLLLDEPTQGMGIEDVARITELIRIAARGRTVLMVEHNLKVVATLADTITVLARGRRLAEGSYAAVSQDPLVREAYLGHGGDAHA